jgi:predicted alpha/beta superfamily hydrolase
MGHSFGGYFTCYAMLRGITNYPLFNNYIAASPSLWYHDNYLFEQFKLLTQPIAGKKNKNSF